MRRRFSGFAIPIAWPETMCKRAGAWYDLPLHYAGISKGGYYRVGHAAVVLIEEDSGSCQYYDFGRYHAPSGYGRVRSAVTDHELKMTTRANISSAAPALSNLGSILMELAGNPATHGTGPIFGSVVRIHAESSLEYAQTLQSHDFIPYGPFVRGGTNCSRFVRDIMLAGAPGKVAAFLLKNPPTLTPSPMWNLKAGIGMASVHIPVQGCHEKNFYMNLNSTVQR